MNPTGNVSFVCLLVLDGWGLAPPSPGNAIARAATPNIKKFMASYPHTQLEAGGEAVGLPRGEAGNTETGHLNLGAGRIVYQDLARINISIADGTFFTNPVLMGAIEHARKNNSNLHYMGLIGAGGVHSNIEHLFALLTLAKKQNFNRVYLHLFTDGRDSPPTAANIYVSQIRDVAKREGVGQIVSLMGRYWAMDRDLRWERTQKAFYALTQARGHLVKTPEEAINASYSAGITDEFIEPAIISNSQGQPAALIKEKDAVVFFNFRIDRPRQLSRMFVDPNVFGNLYFVTMTLYEKPLVEAGAKVAFPPEIVTNPLGRLISDAAMRQLRMSESEKERFVTFYFNGLQEIAFPAEERIIVPSPKVATYDQKPEMSARQLTETFLTKLRANSDIYKFILINFANVDMVGHTGSIGATVAACQVVDECVGKIVNFVLAYNGAVLITADHGNAEEMIHHKTGQIETEHSANPVPFLAVANHLAGKQATLGSGVLADVAPTVLALLGLEKPDSMTGRNLLEGIN